MADKFRVLIADPAWPFKDKLPGDTRGAARNYKTQTISEIMRMELPPLDENCVLGLWRVASMQQEALDVIKAWGFRQPEREIVWLKKTTHGRRWFGMGHVVRAEHEICLIALRGRPQVINHSVRSTFVTEEQALINLRPDVTGFSAKVPKVEATKKYKHSAKPEIFFDIVESMFPGPYAEVHARRHRPAWLCIGDELPRAMAVEEATTGTTTYTDAALEGTMMYSDAELEGTTMYKDKKAPNEVRYLEGSGGINICRCNEYETCAVCLSPHRKVVFVDSHD